MHHRLAVGLFAFIFVFCGSRAGANDANPPVKVKFENVFEVDAPDGPLYRVDYNYVTDAKHVRILGVGLLPGQGTLNYLTREKKITFLDPSSNATIGSAQIPRATRMMGDNDLNLPDPSQFRKSFLGKWRGARDFTSHVLMVLNQEFTLGYFPFERQGRQNFLTTWRRLPKVKAPLSGQVAILLTYPADVGLGEVQFTVGYCTREKRSHSVWRFAPSEETATAVGDYMSNLVVSLEAP